jgi:hypothetical protein
MRLGDLLFIALAFTGGVITGVFLRESEMLTGDHIKKTTKTVVDKFRNTEESTTTEKVT